MSGAFTFKISPEGIAELCFDLPGEKMNTFSQAVLEELELQLDRIEDNSAIKALKLVSGKKECFIAGADLKGIQAAFDHPEDAEKLIRTGHRVFSRLQQLPFPTIACINGFCLGGGLEFALSCTYRIISDHPKTLLGLPEVSIGLIPGWGGTQRLPRLIGLTNALNLILTGELVSAKKAYQLHLADALVAWEFFDEGVEKAVQNLLSKEGKKAALRRRAKKSWLFSALESNSLGRSLVFRKAKAKVFEKTKGHYPAPLLALDLIHKSYPLPLQDGLKAEMECFTGNMSTGFQLARDLIHLFFVREGVKKTPQFLQQVKPRDVMYAAVIGAGTMGAEIAWLLADHQISTRMKDISYELLGKGMAIAKKLFDKGLAKKKRQRNEYERALLLLSGTVDYSGFQQVSYVIEAATENLELKRAIFREVEAAVSPDTIIATNTSSLTVEELSEGMSHPERFVGMHFFYPASKMPLVEVVAGKQSSLEAVATAVALCKKLGKTPIVVKDCPGFLVNRILLAGMNEILHMLEEGYSVAILDKILLDFGLPMSPFALLDEVGNDVSYKAACSLAKTYGERMKPALLLERMVSKGLLGKKSGKGFFVYWKGKSRWNSEVTALLRELGLKRGECLESEILPRFLRPMEEEARRCLDEGVVSDPDVLDLSLILGMGYPPYRGGLLRHSTV